MTIASNLSTSPDRVSRNGTKLPPAETIQTELEEIEADRRRMGVIAWVLGAWFIIAAAVGAWVAL